MESFGLENPLSSAITEPHSQEDFEILTVASPTPDLLKVWVTPTAPIFTHFYIFSSHTSVILLCFAPVFSFF